MTKAQQVVIGSKTVLDFPKFGIQYVPAKVDTGADSSSLWASNINEKHSRLSFTLFGPNSPFYTGEIITTREYNIRSIRNSFGHSELRYVVKLRAVVEGRSINISFSLSDRSNNQFPVLIGRRTLQGRFLVDVAQMRLKEKLRVLVLKPRDLKKSGVAANFFHDIEKNNKNIHFTFASFNDLRFYVIDNNIQIKIAKTNHKITDFDMIYFRIVADNKDIASAVAQFLQKRNIPFFDRAAVNYYQSLNKLHQSIVLHNAQIKTPDTIFISKEDLPKAYKILAKNLGKNFVLKDIRGKKGRCIYFVDSKSSFSTAVKQAKEKNLDLIAQKFIPHDGHYRVLIMGKQIRLVNYRVHSLAEPRRNSPDEGVQSKLVDQNILPGNVREMAIKAADSLMIDLAGVDVLQDKETGVWYCLEVNESPQLVTGSFIEEKKEMFTEYLENKLQKLA